MKHRRGRARVFHAAQHTRYRAAVLGLPAGAKKTLVSAARKIVRAPLDTSPRQHVEFYEQVIRDAAKKSGLSFARAGTIIDHITDALYAQARRSLRRG